MPQFRLNSAEDFEKFYQLYLYAFNALDEPSRRKYFFERCQHGLIYGIKQGEKLTSGLYSLPFRVDFHGTKYLMNGIGDVATAPESAGQGGASTLLQAALNEMSANKVTLSYLAPFSFKYYRRFGYEQVFNHLQYSLNNKNVPAFRPRVNQGHVTRGKMKDHLPEIVQMYERTAKNGLMGGLLRDMWWWDYLPLKNKWLTGVYYDEQEQVSGYVIYELTQEQLVVKEMIYATNTAFEHLLSFIFNHKNSVRKFIFDSPDPTYHGSLLSEPYVLDARVVPYMMVRIVDIKDFLLRYPYVKKDFEPFAFGIEDQNLPQNFGLWELSSKEGMVKVNKLSDLAADYPEKITIQELTKALFGTEKMKTIVMEGKADLSFETATLLDDILVNEPPKLVDYF